MKKAVTIAVTLVASLSLAACSTTTGNTTAASQVTKAPVANTTTQQTSEAAPAYYYTANNLGISKVDAIRQQVVETIPAEGAVHNVQISPDGKILAATLVPAMGHGDSGGHGHGDMKMNGYALFYNTQTNELIQKVEVGQHPAHIVFTENQKYALVTNNEDNQVSVIDLASYKVTSTIAVGQGPHGFRISADSRYAYIANMGEDSVSIVDLEQMKELKKIIVGKTPVTTGVTSDGKTLVVTLNQENAVAIVNLENEQVNKLPVGIGPAQVYIEPDNKFAFVANQGTKEQPSQTITKIDIASKQVVATIETGKGAHGIVTSKDNQFVYVTNMYDNTVSVIQNDQNKVIATVKVGEEPNGITYQQ